MPGLIFKMRIELSPDEEKKITTGINVYLENIILDGYVNWTCRRHVQSDMSTTIVRLMMVKNFSSLMMAIYDVMIVNDFQFDMLI